MGEGSKQMICTVFRRTENGNGIPVAYRVPLEEAVEIVQSESAEFWLFYEGTSTLATLN